MANALLTPSKWSDKYGSPPNTWNAVDGKYENLDNSSGTSAQLSSAGPYGLDPSSIDAGDTVAFTFDVLTPVAVEDQPAAWTLQINGVTVFTVDLGIVGTIDYTSPVLAAGDVVFGDGSANGHGIYSGEFTIAPTADAPPNGRKCEELGRVTRIYASGYERARVHDGQLVRGESRCLVVEFNGAIAPARTVASVTWRCVDPSVVVMSNARIQTDARSVAIDVRANWPSDTLIKCEATLDNGEVYAQLIHISVGDSWWFGDETAASGPMVLTA